MSNWTELHAGPLAMAFDPESAFLRRIRLGGREVLRCIYSAVRDEHWGTVRPSVSNVKVEQKSDQFRLSFDVACVGGGVDFAWHGTITGQADGTVTFAMRGEARSTFKRQRLGFCVLHPLRECVDRPCVVERPDGSTHATRFPRFIEPHQPFRDVRAIRCEAAPGVQAEVRCEGDVFETEDQRNWTDGSFKTYCTPLDLPRPVEVAAGTVVEQTITVRLHGTMPAAAAPGGPVDLAVSDRPIGQLPRLGLAVASGGQTLGLRELPRLKALHLSHLRVELRLAGEDWPEQFARACGEARELAAALEVALLLPDEPEEGLRALRRDLLKLEPRILSWLVFPDAERATTPPELVADARNRLSTDDRRVLFGGGTHRYFTELNRERPSAEALDIVAYSLNPQVHTFDDASMAESLEGQAWTVRSAHQFCGAVPVAVGPITLKPRGGRRPAGEGELPPNVDPRQMSLFCAAWTLGSVSALAEAGLHSVTYYETVGWLGVMEAGAGSPLPEKFPSKPGTVFPVYHVLADLGEFAMGEVVPVVASDPVRVRGLVVRKRGRNRLLVANLTDEPQKATVRGLGGFLTVHALNEKSLAQATRAPEAFRSTTGKLLNADAKGFPLALPPYGLVRIDSGR